MQDFEDVTAGWELIVTMQPRTPLAWLTRHKEYHAGPHRPEEILPPERAIWAPKSKSWLALGLDLPEMPPSTMASPVGQIPEDGGDFLPFLIRYRTIIETLEPDRHEAEITALKSEWPVYAQVLEPKRRSRTKPTPTD